MKGVFKVVSTEKNASVGAGDFMSCKARFSFHSPHKQLDIKFQVLFVTYTTIQRLYNQQLNVSQVRSMDSANIVEYNTREVCIK